MNFNYSQIKISICNSTKSEYCTCFNLNFTIQIHAIIVVVVPLYSDFFH